jgi:hypothetical protein
MLVNNAISAGVGLVPGVGDVFLAMYKANSRNAELLEEFLRIRGDEFLKMQEQERATQALQTGALEGNRWRKGVSKKDAEQVKPGAGIVKGEVVPTEPTVSTATKQKNETPGNASGRGRKVFSIFGGGKSGGSPDGKAPSPGDKGRFVEDIVPTVPSSHKA